MDAESLNAALPFVPHEVAPHVDCCGCIVAEIEGETVKLVCNECGAVVGTVDLAILTQLLGLECAKATCPHCGKSNAFPGLTEVEVYTCQHCGRAVEPAPPPAVN
jgi:hypothetical protein